MKKTLVSVALVLALAIAIGFGIVSDSQAGVSVASSNTACFDWSCDGALNATCTFDSSCSVTNSGRPWQQLWTWGDGSNTLLPPSTATHQYSGQSTAQVTLLKYHFGGNSPSVTCQIQLRNPFGPPSPLSGRCQ